jgi:cytochrome c553
MGKKFVYLITIISMFYTSGAIAQGNPEAGAQKVQACGFCHGPDGNSMNPIWPKLAGQHPQYIAKQLQDFKSGNRSNPQMSPMTAALSEQDMMDIAEFYASKAPSESKLPDSMEPREVELGERIYRAGDAGKKIASCMACHGPTARGNPAANYPKLAGQHAAYTAAQLQAFKTGARANDANAIMRDVALKLTNEEIEEVSAYLQGLY